MRDRNFFFTATYNSTWPRMFKTFYQFLTNFPNSNAKERSVEIKLTFGIFSLNSHTSKLQKKIISPYKNRNVKLIRLICEITCKELSNKVILRLVYIANVVLVCIMVYIPEVICYF